MEMVPWQLPEATADRPHRMKYRLYLGRDGRTLVRYDTEAGKGDHRHVGAEETERPYRFTSVERLLSDFLSDSASYGWSTDDETDPR